MHAKHSKQFTPNNGLQYTQPCRELPPNNNAKGGNSQSSKQNGKGNGNGDGNGKSNPRPPKPNYDAEKLCTICGGKDMGDCFFKGHPSANHTNSSFKESQKEKEYLNHFKKKDFTKLMTSIMNSSEKYSVPKKGETSSHYINDKHEQCHNCATCKSLKLNDFNIPIDNESDDHLLLSYIKVNNTDEPLLIKAFLDSGSLQEGGNYINQSVFNRLRLNNDIIIVNKKSQTCTQILNT